MAPFPVGAKTTKPTFSLQKQRTLREEGITHIFQNDKE
jgi:hypothetical protein